MHFKRGFSDILTTRTFVPFTIHVTQKRKTSPFQAKATILKRQGLK